MKNFWIPALIGTALLAGCTEEKRNVIFKEVDNYLGKDMKVSYVADNGQIVKSWTVKDGKVTTQKNPDGSATGYYFFWSLENGYVQIPVIRTIIEEIKQ